MSINYNAIKGRKAAVTLPSVVGGFGTMNILRTPPKSVMTRRVDKVSESNIITKLIGNSGNRINEAIRAYPRGIDPMVSVSYSNASNNAGQNPVGFGPTVSNRLHVNNAYSPYSFGALGMQFRPPLRRQEDLMPLSRQARLPTQAFAQPGFADYSKKILCRSKMCHSKAVRKEILKSMVPPTKVMQYERPVREGFEVKNMINQNPIHFAADAGVRSLDISKRQPVQEPLKELNKDPLHAYAQANLLDPTQSRGGGSIRDFPVSIKQYITEFVPHATVMATKSQYRTPQANTLQHTAVTNDRFFRANDLTSSASAGFQGYSMDKDIHNDRTVKLRDDHAPSVYNVSANVGLSDHHYKPLRPQNEIVLARKTPLTAITTNIGALGGGGGGASSAVMNRDYKLPPSLKKGGFTNSGTVAMPLNHPQSLRHDPAAQSMKGVADKHILFRRKQAQETQSSRRQPSLIVAA